MSRPKRDRAQNQGTGVQDSQLSNFGLTLRISEQKHLGKLFGPNRGKFQVESFKCDSLPTDSGDTYIPEVYQRDTTREESYAEEEPLSARSTQLYFFANIMGYTFIYSKILIVIVR